MTICIYGTVYNNAFSVEESVRSFFDPSYFIVITDSYSTDGTWEKLQEIRKEYNLTLLRLKSTRGKGRDYALKHCPENSLTAYVDLDTIYNQNFHKLLKEEIDGTFIISEPYSFIGKKGKIGHWADLNYGEDIEFLSRLDIRITLTCLNRQRF
jgi:glycosyltransferase involved in cell wall biosynthesis